VLAALARAGVVASSQVRGGVSACLIAWGDHPQADCRGGGRAARLSGTYRPPLEPVGGLVKALLHRLAEAAVKDLLDQIGYRVTGAALLA
jgi:hypothetical protein